MAIKDFVKPGLDRKLPARILTVDKERRQIEATLRDGGLIYITVYTISATFQWPVTGDLWYVRRDGGLWNLDTPIDLAEQGHDGIAVENMDEGAMRVSPTPSETGSGYWIGNYEASRKVAATIGDGVNTTIDFRHGLGTLDVSITVYLISTGVEPTVTKQHLNLHTVRIIFTTTPPLDAYRIVVQG